MSSEWAAGKWLFQGLLASVVSGVGFVFLTLVFEYGKRYRRQRREREQQVILEKLLRGDMVLEWNNPQAVVPVSKGCVLRDLSSSHRGSFLISNYKQRGGFLGVGRGYYAQRNIPGGQLNSDTELKESRITFAKCSNLIQDTSQLGENGKKTPESALRLIPSGKTSIPESKDEARIFQKLINSPSTLSINGIHRKDSGEPAQKDVSQAHMCKKMCKEMCFRVVKEHPFIAPFIRRDLLQEMKLEVTTEPKVSNSCASSSVTAVPPKCVQLCESLYRSPANETNFTGVKSMPKMRNRGRSMSRGPQKMRNTPIQLEKRDSLVQKTSMSGVSKNTDWVLSQNSDTKPENQTPNNITGTAHKCKLLKNVKSRRSSSLYQRTPLNDQVSFAQISKLAQNGKSVPEEGAENVKKKTFESFDDNGSSVDPMTAFRTIITEHYKDKAEYAEEFDHIDGRKVEESLGRENSESTSQQSAQCISGTGDKSCTEGRINEIVSTLTSWGYSIKNKVQGKETESTANLLDNSVNVDTLPDSSKLNAKGNAEITKLNSKALVDFIKNLTESRKNRKLLRQISSVLTRKTTGRLSKNSKSFSKTRIPAVASSVGTSVITTDKTPVRLSRNKSFSKTLMSSVTATTGTPVITTDKTPARLSKNTKSFSKTQLSPMVATAVTPVITTDKTPVRLSRNKSFSKTLISSVVATTGTPVTTTDKTPVKLSKNSKSFSKTHMSSLAATTGTPVITTDKTSVKLSKNSKPCSKTQISSLAATPGPQAITTDKTPVRLSKNSKSFSKTQLSPMVATTGTPVTVKSPRILQESKDKKNINVVSEAGSIVPQDIKKTPSVKRRRIVRDSSYFVKLASTYKKESDCEKAYYETSVLLPSSQSRKSSPPKLENELKEKLQTPQKGYRKSLKSMDLKRLVLNKMEPRVLKKNIIRNQTRRPNSPKHQEVERDNLEVVSGVHHSEYRSENPKRSQTGDQSNAHKSSKCNHKVGNDVTDHAEKATQVEEITPFSTPFSDSLKELYRHYNDGIGIHQHNEIETKLQTVDLCLTNEAVSSKFCQSVSEENVEEVRNDNVASEAPSVNLVKEKDIISQNGDFILSGVKEAAMRTSMTSIRRRKVENQREQKRTVLTRSQLKHSTTNKVQKSAQTDGSDLFSEIRTFKPTHRKAYATSINAASVVKCDSLPKQQISGYKDGSKKLQHKVETAERHTVSVKTKSKEQQTQTFVKRGQNNEISQPSANKSKASKHISNEIRSQYEQYQKSKLQEHAPLRKRKSSVNKEVKVEQNQNINRALLQHRDRVSETGSTSHNVGQLNKINASPLLPPTSIIDTNCTIESVNCMSSLEAESRQTDYHSMLDSSTPFENDRFELHSDGEDVAWGTKKSDNIGQKSFSILKKSRLDCVVSSMMDARSIFRTTDS